MATRVTYHQLLMGPTTDGADASLVVPHVKEGWVQAVQVDFVGGGGEHRWRVHVLSFEPLPDEEEKPATKTTRNK